VHSAYETGVTRASISHASSGEPTKGAEPEFQAAEAAGDNAVSSNSQTGIAGRSKRLISNSYVTSCRITKRLAQNQLKFDFVKTFLPTHLISYFDKKSSSLERF
jgi:hypothetical protein